MTALSDRVRRLLDAALAAVPRSQERPGQRDMAAAVDRALRTREHLLVQAGTGTGKSLAYLVPALASGRRVVVATATKALQAQLVDKDLPRLVAALAGPLGRTPTYALAKGRGNYLCLQQVHGGPGAVQEPEGLFETASSALGAQVVALREWAGQTRTGDRDEVPFPVTDRAWRQVSVSARDCLGARCPDRVDCFAEQAREAAKEVDLVVANHALLALDVFTGAGVLPEHDAVVVDEAHEFVAAATEALTAELGRSDLRRATTLAADALAATTRERLQDAADALEGLLGVLEPGWVRRLPPEATDVLALVESTCGSAAAEAGRTGGDVDEAEKAQRERARTALTEVAAAASEIRVPDRPERGVRRRRAGLGAPAGLAAARRRGAGGAAVRRADGGRDVGHPHPGRLVRPRGRRPGPARRRGGGGRGACAAGARGRRGPAAALAARRRGQPVRLRPAGPALGRRGPAAALAARLGAGRGRAARASWSRRPAGARWACSARRRRPRGPPRPCAPPLDVPVLLQGEDSPGALAHRFASDARTCLFGTRSFWQGVDTPGSACQLVVIDRIPFAHVEDPLVRARLEAAGAAGFATVTLPPAAVLLAQGAGRLVRSSGDRGVVAVLDPRLATASYAPVLLATLPGLLPGALARRRCSPPCGPSTRARRRCCPPGRPRPSAGPPPPGPGGEAHPRPGPRAPRPGHPARPARGHARRHRGARPRGAGHRRGRRDLGPRAARPRRRGAAGRRARHRLGGARGAARLPARRPAVGRRRAAAVVGGRRRQAGRSTPPSRSGRPASRSWRRWTSSRPRCASSSRRRWSRARCPAG